MSCGPLTTAQDYECDDSIGGIEQGSILISQWEDITAFTEAAGVITTLTQAPSTNFFRYQVKKFIADAITTEVHDPLLGTTSYDTVLNMMLNKLSAAKNVEFQLLVSKPVAVIYKDNEGTFWIMGIDNGAEKMGGTNQSATGKVQGDQNGYTFGFTSIEKHYPFEVDSITMASIQISGEQS